MENHLPPESEPGLFDRAAMEATRVNYLTKENAEFKDNAGYLTMNGERVLLHRLFPYDSPFESISVLNSDKKEIGIIKDVSEFDGEMLDAVKKELERKYYVREIVKILELKDHHGMTYWKVKCAENTDNVVEFSLRDTYGSMFRVTDTRLIITDSDGNRFSITDVKKLDRKSYRKIELYL